MDCLLVFNHLNDLVYKKYNQKFENHILELALSQGLIQVSFAYLRLVKKGGNTLTWFYKLPLCNILKTTKNKSKSQYFSTNLSLLTIFHKNSTCSNLRNNQGMVLKYSKT